MENNETYNGVEETGILGKIQLISLAFILYMLACIPGALFCAKSDEFEKKVAQEYSLPLSVTREMLGSHIQNTLKYLPYPHDVWYVTLENGSDVTVGTAYFGIVSLKESNVDTYFPLRELRRELGAHNFPFSSYE